MKFKTWFENDIRLPPGKCWYCGKPKKNIYGLCTHCGRFGKPDNAPSIKRPPDSDK